jgi:Putative zinc-finger/Predicted integral membrane protein (DUF2275)
MNCDEIQAQLSEYLERSLGAVPMALVEEHLAACPPCREETELLSETIGQVAALPAVEPPPGFTQRVMAHVREIEPQPGLWQRLFLPLRQKLPVQATALVMLGILAVFLLQKEETHKQITAIQPAQVTDGIKQDNTPARQAFPAPPTTSTSKTKALAKRSADESRVKPVSPRASQPDLVARRERAQIAGSLASESTESLRPATPAAAPEPGDRAAPMISGTAVANHVSSQTGGGTGPLAFPFESDPAAAFRSASSAIMPFADYELVVRRHGRPPAESRGDVTGAVRKTELSQAAERPSTPRAIDRLMAAIPDQSRPQTIWVTVPKNQYEQFKKELHALGTIESETQVPLLRDQTAAQTDGQIRVKLTAMPGTDSPTPNPPASR